jgi:predicted DNA-binding transcriptional regulator AlpA
METLYTPLQTAQILGIEPATLTKWRNKRKAGLLFVRIGHNSIRYRESDVRAFIDSRVVRVESPKGRKRR